MGPKGRRDWDEAARGIAVEILFAGGLMLVAWCIALLVSWGYRP